MDRQQNHKEKISEGKNTDFIKSDGTLKNNNELEEENIKLNWWETIQLESRYNKDKKEKFYLKLIPLEEIFLGPEQKMIKKFYN